MKASQMSEGLKQLANQVTEKNRSNMVHRVVHGLIERPKPLFSEKDPRRLSPDGSYPPICMDDEHFLISQADFDALPEYSTSKPTGVYDGKCWKANWGGEWCIGCYLEETPPHPDGMLTPFRKALIVT